MTIVVSLIVSCLEGQVTFLSSSIISVAKLGLLVIPYNCYNFYNNYKDYNT